MKLFMSFGYSFSVVCSIAEYFNCANTHCSVRACLMLNFRLESELERELESQLQSSIAIAIAIGVAIYVLRLFVLLRLFGFCFCSACIIIKIIFIRCNITIIINTINITIEYDSLFANIVYIQYIKHTYCM